MTENVNPADLEPGDRVVVDDESGVGTGEVESVESEAGRFCVHVKGDDGHVVACWQRDGRAFHRVEDLDDERRLDNPAWKDRMGTDR